VCWDFIVVFCFLGNKVKGVAYAMNLETLLYVESKLGINYEASPA
jgi:hypothetical protein